MNPSEGNSGYINNLPWLKHRQRITFSSSSCKLHILCPAENVLSWSHVHKSRPMKQYKINSPGGKYLASNCTHRIEFVFKVTFLTQSSLWSINEHGTYHVTQTYRPWSMFYLTRLVSGQIDERQVIPDLRTAVCYLFWMNLTPTFLPLYLTMILKSAHMGQL